VTTAAFLMAEAFGCSPIIMVGQDLANTGGKRAAAGVLADKLAVLSDHGSVMRWGDDMHHTFNPRSRAHYWDEMVDSPQWLHARVWFEQRAALLQERGSGVQLLNCTEGGSHVLGFEDALLADVLEQLRDREVDVMSKLDNVAPIASDTVDWFVRQQTDMLVPIIGLANEIAATCAEAARLVREVAPTQEVQATMDKRSSVEDEFRRAAQKSALFIGSAQIYLKGLNDVRETATRNQIEGEKAAEFFATEAKIFGNMGALAQTLHEGIREA
jgi:hypothetical protein